MVNVCGAEVPPPGAGVDTVTLAVPALAISVAGIVTVNSVECTKVVARAAPFQCTAELVWNPVPCTVKVNDAPPCVALAGDSEVMAGTGLSIVKVRALEEPPP